MKTPVNISAVRVEGATHTRKSFLAGVIEPAVSSSSAAGTTTLEDALHTTRRISYGLQKTDIFSAVSASLEPPQSGLASPHVGDVDLVFKTKERGRWYVSTATEVGNSEGTAVCIRSFRTSRTLIRKRILLSECLRPCSQRVRWCGDF